MERERTRAVVNTPATRLCTTSLVIEMVTIMVTVNRIKFMTSYDNDDNVDYDEIGND